MNDLQKAEYEVLKEVLTVFTKNNLRYFAIGGTCIGAVRHGGFIPWDDDIDLAMPREDFELFKAGLYRELPDFLKKIDYDNSVHNNTLALKIHNPSTTLVDSTEKNQPDRFSGVHVDIMPVDGLPNNSLTQIILTSFIRLLSVMNNIIRLYDIFPRKHLGKKQYIKDLIKRFFGKIISLCHFRQSKNYHYYSDLISNVMRKNPYDNSQNLCFTWRLGMKIKYKRKVFNSSIFKEAIPMKFEDILINVPKNYDAYLKQDFGNYMELPPKEERNSGHKIYIYDLTKPCEYYAQLEREKMNK